MYTNDTWSHTFTEVGTFAYHCHPHQWMQAEIQVLEANGSAPVNHTIGVLEPEDFEQWTFDPAELTLRVGDTVTWVNPGAVMHKVAETTDEHAAHIAGAGSTVATQGDGHDHAHDEGGGSFNQGVLWVLGGLLLGIGVAQWAKKQSP